MNVTPNQARFTHYPTDHVLGIVPDGAAVERLCTDLDGQGIAGERIKVFYGRQGRDAFDHDEKGLQGWWQRTSSALTGTRQDKLAYTDALEQGQYVVAVDLHGHQDERDAVGQAFRLAGAQDVNFLGELVVDNLG